MTWKPGAPRPPRWIRDIRQGPSLGLYVSELNRAALDCGALFGLAPLLATAPRGDGHPVLVLPGLIADDASTLALRVYLRQLGYSVSGWDLGRNIGPTPEIVDGMRSRLSELHEEHRRKVSVIGWSLGGIYARELARESPDAVRQVITLGSPYRLSHPDQSYAYRVFERYSHLHIDPSDLPPPEAKRPPLPVPSTSVYSRLDGIVAWRACIEVAGDGHENVAVYSSHLGLGYNPAVMWVVADRLARAEGDLAPFKPPSVVRLLFPRPDKAPAAA